MLSFLFLLLLDANTFKFDSSLLVLKMDTSLFVLLYVFFVVVQIYTTIFTPFLTSHFIKLLQKIISLKVQPKIIKRKRDRIVYHQYVYVDQVNSIRFCIIIMFCCTRKQTHKGQIVTALCLEPQCTKNRNQLSCSLCTQEDHAGHNIASLRKVVPELLEVEREKEEYKSMLTYLTQFVCRQFGEENEEGEASNVHNVIQRVVGLLSSLKQQVDINTEQMSKMKSIFKNLNKNNQQNSFKTSKIDEIPSVLPDSPQKSNPSSIMFKASQSSVSKINQLLSFSPQLDCFSHTAKHPYLSISSNLRTATKVSHSGHRFAAIGGKNFSQKQHQVRVRIDKSISGNIMVGVCHQSVVRQKQFCNTYGSSSGTYLIGQNGNNPGTAISFHHSVSVMNRKEIVGWNFEENDLVVIGINFTDSFIYFRKEGKRPSQEFSMKISATDIRPQLKALISEGFKLIVLLQSEGDQVTIVEE